MTLLQSAIWGELGPFLLEVTRVAGLVMLSPVPFEAAPKRAKVAIILLLSVVAHGTYLPAEVVLNGPLPAFLSVTTELLIGLGMGFIVRMAIGVAEVAGSSIAPLIGFGAAQMFDPGTGQQDSVMARVLRLFAILLALAVGLHRVIIAALLKSFEAVPVGSAVHIEAGAEVMLELSAQVIASGVRLVLPIMAVLLMVQVALGFVARAAPAMQIFNVGFAVLLAVGGGLLWLLVPDIGRELQNVFSHVAEHMEGFLIAITDF